MAVMNSAIKEKLAAAISKQNLEDDQAAIIQEENQEDDQAKATTMETDAQVEGETSDDCGMLL